MKAPEATRGEQEKPSAARRGTLSLLLFASTLTVMAGSILAPVVEVIRGDLGLSGTEAGLVITTHALAIAVASPVAGWMLDRWGVRLPLSGGLVLYGLAGGAGLFIDSYAVLLATRVVFGAGASLIFAGTTLAMLNLYQGTARDRVMGWRGTASSLGGVLWPLLSGVIGGISWHLPFGVYLLGVPLGLATALRLPRQQPPREAGPSRKKLRAVTLLRRHRMLLAWYGLQFCASLLLYALIVFLPARLAAEGVKDPFLVSLYTVGMSGAMSLIGLAYAALRTRLGYTFLLRSALALWAAAFLLLAVAPNAPLLFLAPLLFGLGQGVFFPVVTVVIADGVPAAVRGQATSLSGTAMFTGQFVSPVLVGPLVQATSVSTGFLIAAAIPALALLAVCLTRPATEPRVDETVPQDSPTSPAPQR